MKQAAASYSSASLLLFVRRVIVHVTARVDSFDPYCGQTGNFVIIIVVVSFRVKFFNLS